MTLLETLADEPGGLTLADLTRKLGWPTTTVHGFVATLRRWNMVVRDEATGRLFLGSRIFRLAGHVDRSQTLIRLIHPHLESLAEKYDETVHLAVPDVGGVLYLDKVECRRPYRMTSMVGTRETFFESAIGLVLAARSESASFTKREKEILDRSVEGTTATLFHPESDLYCLAAAISRSDGEPVAGISLAVPKIRYSEQIRKEILGDLTDLADRLREEW